MDLSGYAPGKRIPAGNVYRRIPNLPTHFDYETGRPRLPAAHLDFGEAEAALKQQRLSGFGLCALDVAEMQARTAGKAWVEFAPTRSWGLGNIGQMARRLAVIVSGALDAVHSSPDWRS